MKKIIALVLVMATLFAMSSIAFTANAAKVAVPSKSTQGYSGSGWYITTTYATIYQSYHGGFRATGGYYKKGAIIYLYGYNGTYGKLGSGYYLKWCTVKKYTGSQVPWSVNNRFVK